MALSEKFLLVKLQHSLFLFGTHTISIRCAAGKLRYSCHHRITESQNDRMV